MAGRSASANITRYPGIQIQTSSAGLTIPQGWGTFRCKTNLLWYGDFKSTAVQTSGGKGGGGSTVTGYNYSASFVLGICQGPIDAITTVYVDSKIYTNGPSAADPHGVGTALSQAKLSMNTGAVGQAVWSYLTSNFPSQAIGYSGLAIAYAAGYALNSGATTPNFAFEVEVLTGFQVGSTPNADPSLIVTDFFQNTRTGVPQWPSGLLDAVSLTSAANSFQAYTLAAGLILSPVIDSARSAKDWLDEFFKATNSTCVWSEGKLKFIPYGDTAITGNGKTYTPNLTPVYSITDDFYCVDKDVDPVNVDVMDQSNAYNVVQIEYLDRTNSYNMAIALASDQANVEQFGMRRKDPESVHMICDLAVASMAAQLYLQRALYVRQQFKFSLDWRYALLEPGDLLEITDAGLGLNLYGMRIIQIDEGPNDPSGKPTYDLICEELLVGINHTPLYLMAGQQGASGGTNLDPGGVEANLILYSDSPANAAWTKTNLTITANSTTDQYGLTLASTMTTNTSAGVHGISQSISAFAGDNYIAGACIKVSALNNYRLSITDAGGTNGVYVDVDANAGTVLDSGVLGSGVLVSASINATLVAGIWQVVLCGQVPSVTTLYMHFDVNSAANAHSWTPGSNLTAGYVSQLQIRQGAAIGVYSASGAMANAPLMFNPPVSLTKGNTPEVWAAVAGGPNWGGADVYVSIDGTNYQFAGVCGASRYGYATASYASHADPDTSDTLSVDLSVSAGTLSSASDATADAGGSMMQVDTEAVCFSTATLTNPSRYNLTSYIRRGYASTTVAAHAAGATLVRLDGSPFQLPYLAQNIGQSAWVKFASFNKYGQQTKSLAECIAYPFAPTPTGPNSPLGGWSAFATSLSNAGQSVPAIEITGTVPVADYFATVTFYYRVSGASAWVAGAGPYNSYITGPNITTFITAVQPNQYYDVGVSYTINGVQGPILVIATGIQVGLISTGTAPGSVLIFDQVIGSGKTFNFPAGSYAHADIVLNAAGGNGSLVQTGGGGKSPPVFTPYGGSGGSTAVVVGVAVTPGSSSVTYTLAAIASPSTLSGLSLTLSSPSGISASTGAGAAPSNATGGTHNYQGHAGGLVDTWDGGGSADLSGTYVDNTTDGTDGYQPGQGGAGGNNTTGVNAKGAPATLTIIARA